MENRKPYVLVGAITLLLVVAIFAFVFWLARFSGESRKEYDIFFRQSVAGLSTGSAVTFSGVPIGQVKLISLMPETPEFVRVRIQISQDVPVLEGTTAALQGLGFTGGIQVQLKGAMRDAPEIDAPGPFGAPVIPSTSSGLGELMESAPQVLERTSTLLARLNEVFDDENRAALAGMIRNLDKITEVVAGEDEAIRKALREAAAATKAAGDAATRLAEAGATANTLMRDDIRPLIGDLRTTVASADKALKQVDALAGAATPGVESFSSETIPEANRLIRDLRDISESLGAISSKLDEDPLGAVVGGRALPDYVPEKQ